MPADSKNATSGARIGTLVVSLLMGVGGCGHSGLQKVPLAGNVTIHGQPIPDGEIRFVPIEGTKGPVSVGNILVGEYEIEARGGVPVGNHRVEIRIVGKPATPVVGNQEVLTGGSTSSVGPRIYDSPQSPLTAEVSRQNEGKLDFAIP